MTKWILSHFFFFPPPRYCLSIALWLLHYAYLCPSPSLRPRGISNLAGGRRLAGPTYQQGHEGHGDAYKAKAKEGETRQDSRAAALRSGPTCRKKLNRPGGRSQHDGLRRPWPPNKCFRVVSCKAIGMRARKSAMTK
ncbi:hypothetical protein F4809DRAFT_270045 [Biscogniauxia mediterranea]|nr:hypothetical protein F4809DRAFT_270045 [Biscogniauxia mediterranea]